MSTSKRALDNTTATLPFVTTRGNQKPVEDFISYIRERVGTATRNWREIAQAFAEAKEMYGADSDAFKRLCKATKFTRSTADRLAKVAASARLKEHEPELAAVHSWSTLHAITLLDDAQFAQLLKERSGDFITESMVAALRKGPPAKKDSWGVFATIYVDQNAMKGQLFNGDHVEALRELLSRAQTDIPYLKVTESHAEEKIESHFQARVAAESKCILRAKLNSAIDGYARSAKMPPLNEKGKLKSPVARRDWVIANCFGTRAELMADFEENPKKAFEQLSSDLYDQGQVWNEAVSKVMTQRDKFAEKLRFGATQFAEADSASAKREPTRLTFSGSAESEGSKLNVQGAPPSEVPVIPAITETNEPAPLAIAAD